MTPAPESIPASTPAPAHQESDPFAAIIEREGGLQRTLSSRRLSMIAIGGAIGTGLFLGSGLAISLAGPAVLLSYGLGALIALLLMRCLTEMTVAHPTTGSFGAYAEHYIGPLAGFLVRYAYWTCVVLAVGTEVSAIAVYMAFWFPAVPGWIWITAFSSLLILINAVSVNLFGGVEYWLSLIKIVAIVAFILLATYLVAGAAPVTGGAPGSVGLGNYTAHGGFFPRGAWGAWVAVIVAIFSYLSIEMIAVAAAEAAQPEVAVARAFRSTVLRLILFYLLTLALMLAVVPWTAVGASESPFVKVMRALHLPASASVMNFVILIAALSAMNSQLYITTRMMFSLARAGHAPRQLGLLSSRGVPLGALLASTSGIALATVLGITLPRSAFTLMLAISSFGAMFTWMMIFVTHYFFRRRHARAGSTGRWPLHSVPALLGASLMAAVLLTTPFTRPFRPTLLFGAPFLVILIAAYWIRQRRVAGHA